jgi:hypothetical protein
MKEHRAEIARLVVGIIITSLGNIGTAFAYSSRAFAYLKWTIPHHVYTFAAIMSVFVLLAGATLSFWKRKHILSYSTMEAAFGMTFSFNSLLYLPPNYDISRLLAVLSGIYIVSRGFNNMAESRASQASARATAIGT